MKHSKSILSPQETELKNFVCRMQEFQLSQIPPQEVLENRYLLSDSFFDKMETLLRTQERKASFRKIQRGIIAAAAVIALLFLVSHPQYVTEAKNRILQWFSDHVSYHFWENTDVNIIPRYEIRYVPIGYMLEKDDYYESAGMAEYYDEAGNCITFLYGVIDSNLNIYDTSKDFSILSGAHGEKIYYTKTDAGDHFITWSSMDETTFFHVSGILSKEELLEIQAEITPVTEY